MDLNEKIYLISPKQRLIENTCVKIVFEIQAGRYKKEAIRPGCSFESSRERGREEAKGREKEREHRGSDLICPNRIQAKDLLVILV